MAEVIDWIHPSVRDVVIEHLASSNEDRQRFLKATNDAGIGLALSIGGGSYGERVRPLLQTDEDWNILGERLLETVAISDESDHSGLMQRIIDAFEVDEVDVDGISRLRILSKTLGHAVVTEWDRRNSSIRPDSWRILYRLQITSKVWGASANPQKTWDHYFAAAEMCDEDDLEPLTTLASLCEVLEHFEPRFLATVNYPSSVRALFELLDVTIAERVHGLPELLEDEQEEIELEDGRVVTAPVQPGADEEGDLNWLLQVKDLIDELDLLSVRHAPLAQALGPETKEALDVRQSRLRDFEGFDPHEDDREHSADASRARDNFDIAEFFSDL